MKIVVATFYHFFDFPHFAEMQPALLAQMQKLDVRGSLLIAPEGINSTLSGTRESIDAMLTFIKTEIVKSDFSHKESYCDSQPFPRGKVRLKKETISLGEPAPLHKVGTYVDPKSWNALISDPDTIVLDTRNDYEVHLGTFDRAIDPRIGNFKELPAFVRENLKDKTKKIATFCTGGIRCEKFTAWMIDNGYENVYHLNGGILKYLEEVPPEESKWQGECFVFDKRVAVGHGLKPSETASVCFACGQTLTPEDRAKPEYVLAEQCPYCFDK